MRSEFDLRVLHKEVSSIVLDCAFGTVKNDIGMANYEKQVEQEAAYPIPISFYNCYRTVRHEKRGITTPDT